MPSIVIRERDLTSAGNLEVTTNAVYIPGYANIGPVNTPILCETLADFQATFGSEPYMFRTAHDWPTDFTTNAVASNMGKFYEKGEREKSYIMAAELLRLGTPVVYERVSNSETQYKLLSTSTTYSNPVIKTATELWTSTTGIRKVGVTSLGILPVTTTGKVWITAESVMPGRAAADIYFTLENIKVEYKDQSGQAIMEKVTVNGQETDVPKVRYYYTVKVGMHKNDVIGTSEVEQITTNFTFTSDVALSKGIDLLYPGQSFIDNSGLVKFTVADDVEFTGRECFGSHESATSKTLAKYQMNLVLSAKTPAEYWAQVDKTDVSLTIDSDEFSPADMYTMLSLTGTNSETLEPVGYDRLLDKGEYIIKYITSGAYPVFEYTAANSIATIMMNVAAERGDCTALIDHTPNNGRTLLANNDNSVFKCVKSWASSLEGDNASYGAVFTPWGIYNSTIAGKQIMLPASFGYLSALAVSSQQNGSWAAVAGVARGSVPNLASLCQNVTNAIADSYSNRDSISINPITNIKPYGLLIWGNRTLKDNVKKGDLTATSFLSIRQVTSDIKRTVWVAAKTLTFEQNNDILWVNFKAKIIPTLDQMVSGGGLSGYEIKKQKTDKKATIKAKIVLYAIEPVEDWDITIELADQSTEITG